MEIDFYRSKQIPSLNLDPEGHFRHMKGDVVLHKFKIEGS